MFSRPDFDHAVAGIHALLADTDPDTGGPDEAASLARIRDSITAEARAPGRRRIWWPVRPRRRHRRLVITCVALPVLLGATAAGWAVAAGSSPAIRVAGLVLCAGSQKLDAHGYGVISDGTSPTTLCARAWASGKLTGHPVRSVPRLVACARSASRNPNYVSDGSVTVWPDTTCAAVHMSPLPAGYDRAARLLAHLQRYLGAGSRTRCLSVPEADAYARDALARFGMTGWVVTNPWGSGPPAGFAPQGCWEAQSDGSAFAVQVLPLPGRYSPTPKAAVGPLRVMTRALPVTRATCAQGATPETAAAAGRVLRGALRRAGYGDWRVLVSQGTTAIRPCYRWNWYSLARHEVYITSQGWAGVTPAKRPASSKARK